MSRLPGLVVPLLCPVSARPDKSRIVMPAVVSPLRASSGHICASSDQVTPALPRQCQISPGHTATLQAAPRLPLPIRVAPLPGSCPVAPDRIGSGRARTRQSTSCLPCLWSVRSGHRPANVTSSPDKPSFTAPAMPSLFTPCPAERCRVLSRLPCLRPASPSPATFRPLLASPAFASSGLGSPVHAQCATCRACLCRPCPAQACRDASRPVTPALPVVPSRFMSRPSKSSLPLPWQLSAVPRLPCPVSSLLIWSCRPVHAHACRARVSSGLCRVRSCCDMSLHVRPGLARPGLACLASVMSRTVPPGLSGLGLACLARVGARPCQVRSRHAALPQGASGFTAPAMPRRGSPCVVFPRHDMDAPKLLLPPAHVCARTSSSLVSALSVPLPAPRHRPRRGCRRAANRAGRSSRARCRLPVLV